MIQGSRDSRDKMSGASCKGVGGRSGAELDRGE